MRPDNKIAFYEGNKSSLFKSLSSTDSCKGLLGWLSYIQNYKLMSFPGFDEGSIVEIPFGSLAGLVLETNISKGKYDKAHSTISTHAQNKVLLLIK